MATLPKFKKETCPDRKKGAGKILRRAVFTQASYICLDILAFVLLFLSLPACGERAGERGSGPRQFPARRILSCTPE